uniref:Zinc finger protein 35 n=1 Tax=Iconisemion striatum TaxID=60296 RepID=A0A1A7W9B7_9TELE
MSFPSTFGTQLAAFMDKLAKAAVAEITKLVEEGSLDLRLEVRQRDVDIQDLRTRLKMMETELCKAQEAAARRTTEEDVQKPAESQILQDCHEDPQVDVAYPDLKSADLLCEDFSGLDENRNISPEMKPEPENGFHRTDSRDRMTADVVCPKVEGGGDIIWNACSMFENISDSAQQHTPIIPSYAEQQYSAYRNPQNTSNFLLSSDQELADDRLVVPIKIEETTHPVCIGNSTSDSVINKDIRQDLCMQAASQQAGILAALHQRPTAGTSELNEEDGTRTSIRTKRLPVFCRASQKVFICLECDKSFSYLSQLEQHRTTHQSFKPFRCLECGKCFTQKTRLKTHQRGHTGEKPYSCEFCGKLFSRKDNCHRHERFHSGVKPHSCRKCGKSFTMLGKLRKHEESHLLG